MYKELTQQNIPISGYNFLKKKPPYLGGFLNRLINVFSIFYAATGISCIWISSKIPNIIPTSYFLRV